MIEEFEYEDELKQYYKKSKVE